MINIAKNTFKEFVRNKILYVILFVAVSLIFFSIVLSTLALREADKIIIDFSLSLIELFGLISTIFLWSYMLYSELSKNTILLLLSKSPSRSKFILGKFIWFSLLLLLIYTILSLAFVLVLFFHWIWFELAYISSIFLSFIKILIVLSIIIFFSTFVSPFISLLASIAIYIVWHSTSFVKFYLLQTWKVVEWTFNYYLINILYYIVPNFHDLSMKEHLTSPFLTNYSLFHIISSTMVWLIYIAFILIFAILIFNKKEF